MHGKIGDTNLSWLLFSLHLYISVYLEFNVRAFNSQKKTEVPSRHNSVACVSTHFRFM